MRWCGVLSLALFLLPSVVRACTIVLPAYERFDTREYVFYGEVVGHVPLEKPICTSESPSKCEEAWGLKVSVLGALFAPGDLTSGVELYFFDLGAGCEREPMSRDRAQQIAIGSRLKVVAKQLSRFAPAGPTGAVRLDGSRWTGAIVITLPADADIAALRDSVANYAGWQSGRYRPDPDLYFELRKDLLRLRNSSSEAYSKSVLTRLAEYHWLSTATVDSRRPVMAFDGLLKEYLTDRASVRELEGQFWRRQCFSNLLGPEETARLERRRADLTDPALQFCLGKLLAEGRPEQAIPWLEEASRSKFVIADYYLGKLYAQLASKADPRNAARLNRRSSAAYQQAAQRARSLEELGDPWAPLVLAELYYSGVGGLPKDFSKATFLVCRNLKNKPRDYPDPGWWPRQLATCQ